MSDNAFDDSKIENTIPTGELASETSQSKDYKDYNGISCPYCGENIKAIAKKCKHCGEFLSKCSPIKTTNSTRNAPNVIGLIIFIAVIFIISGDFFKYPPMPNNSEAFNRYGTAIYAIDSPKRPAISEYMDIKTRANLLVSYYREFYEYMGYDFDRSIHTNLSDPNSSITKQCLVLLLMDINFRYEYLSGVLPPRLVKEIETYGNSSEARELASKLD